MTEIRYKLRQTFYIIKDAFDDIKRIWEYRKGLPREKTAFTFLDIVKITVSGTNPEYVKKILSKESPTLKGIQTNNE